MGIPVMSEQQDLSSVCFPLQTCFNSVQVPFPVALRVWDAMLLEGEKVLVAAAVSLLKMNKSKHHSQSIHMYVRIYISRYMYGTYVCAFMHYMRVSICVVVSACAQMHIFCIVSLCVVCL